MLLGIPTEYGYRVGLLTGFAMVTVDDFDALFIHINILLNFENGVSIKRSSRRETTLSLASYSKRVPPCRRILEDSVILFGNGI